jgi:hypothetical protein
MHGTSGDDVGPVVICQVRKACSPDAEALQAEMAYLQDMHLKGRLQSIIHRTWTDGIKGRPFLGWDDVSGKPLGRNGHRGCGHASTEAIRTS